MSKFFVNPTDVKSLIEATKKGEIFSIHFVRVAPKCTVCGKSDKKWIGLETCPHCGKPLSFERETLAQKGIENPKDPNDKPNGKGESAKEAMEVGRFKFYDMNAHNTNGTKGGYRQAYISNITRLSIRGNEYYVTPAVAKATKPII